MKSSSSAPFWKSLGQDQASPPVGQVPPAARFMPTPWSVVGNPTHEADEELVGVFELPQEEEEDAGAAKARQLRTQQAARGFDSWRHLPNEIKVRSSRLAPLTVQLLLYFRVMFFNLFLFLGATGGSSVVAVVARCGRLRQCQPRHARPHQGAYPTNNTLAWCEHGTTTTTPTTRNHCCGVRSQHVGGETPWISSRTASPVMVNGPLLVLPSALAFN